MKEYKPIPVAGYTAQSATKVELVNANKRLEECVLRTIDQLATVDAFDKRWLALARTQIEQGFMALNRAVFMPQRVRLPDDPPAE